MTDAELELLDRQFMMAIKNNEFELAEQLLKKGAELNMDYGSVSKLSQKLSVYRMLSCAISSKVSLETDGVKFLNAAARHGINSFVKYFLENGGDIHASDVIALQSASKEGNLEIVKMLIEAGADIHAASDKALKNSAENGHSEVVSLLLKNSNHSVESITAAFVMAADYGHVDSVAVLVANGADLNAAKDEALVLALDNGHQEVLKFLIADCDIEISAKMAETLKTHQSTFAYDLFKQRSLKNNLEKKLQPKGSSDKPKKPNF